MQDLSSWQACNPVRVAKQPEGCQTARLTIITLKLRRNPSACKYMVSSLLEHAAVAAAVDFPTA